MPSMLRIEYVYRLFDAYFGPIEKGRIEVRKKICQFGNV